MAAKVAEWTESEILGLVDEVSELANEMGEWRDNLEEKFSSTSKYEEVSESAEMLEELYNNLDSEMQELQDLIGERNYIGQAKLSLMMSKGTSRPARAARIQDKLNALLDEYLNAAENELAEVAELESEESEDEDNSVKLEVEEILEKIEVVREQVEMLSEVNFPRAFGG